VIKHAGSLTLMVLAQMKTVILIGREPTPHRFKMVTRQRPKCYDCTFNRHFRGNGESARLQAKLNPLVRSVFA
jgi:hypothetical protein